MKIKLLGKNLDELRQIVAQEGLPGFAAKQIAQWLYVKKVRSIDQMTNLSKGARAALSEKYEVGLVEYKGLQISSDGTEIRHQPNRRMLADAYTVSYNYCTLLGCKKAYRLYDGCRF